MDERTVINGYGVARVALGAVMIVVPGVVRPWIGEAARDPDVRSPLRVLAVRDAVLGVALLSAPDDDPAQKRRLLELCGIADSVDAITSAMDFLRSRRAGAALASITAAGGAAIGFCAASSTTSVQAHGSNG